MVSAEAEIIMALTPIFFILILVMATCMVFGSRKTKEYRKDLTNLYVAGRIKQIALKDGINISDEYECYKQFIKKKNMERWDLDDTIEEELKERVMEVKKAGK